MERDLVQAGFALTEPDEAELIVINTCAVTGEAEAKTRKAVRHALGRARSPLVLATGCAVSLHPDALHALSDRVHVEPVKARVADHAVRLIGCGHVARGAQKAVEAAGGVPMAPDGTPRHARVGVKIQDGCNNRCTYCIVWKARGPERSRSVEEVLAQIRAVEAAGLPEVVLTGVNLGAYDGQSTTGDHVGIDELLAIIMRETAIPQIRLSSIEPMDVTDRLIERIASSNGRIAPYLHLPVQSGSSATLARMGRPYRAEEFESLCARMRDAIPTVALSCDLIVGFPGETDAEFSDSLDLCTRVGFSRMHVFRYSARPGTPAAEMPCQVLPSVKEERSRAARASAAELAHADACARIGTTERAVIESGQWGTLGSFHRVVVEDLGASGISAPAIVDVDIIGVQEPDVLSARLSRVHRDASSAKEV